MVSGCVAAGTVFSDAWQMVQYGFQQTLGPMKFNQAAVRNQRLSAPALIVMKLHYLLLDLP